MPTAKLSVNVIDLNISSLSYYGVMVPRGGPILTCYLQGDVRESIKCKWQIYFICSYHVTKVYLLAVMVL